MLVKSILIVTLITQCVIEISSQDQQLGYYSFEKATRLNQIPPRVRKPPYLQSNIPCPGLLDNFRQLSKDTLCGDLNRGFVPLSPINKLVQNQHYPFELIKNKTLYFLAKSLPYLKEDINNIPKVIKLSNNQHLHQPSYYDYNSINRNEFLVGNNLRAKRNIVQSLNGKNDGKTNLEKITTEFKENNKTGGYSTSNVSVAVNHIESVNNSSDKKVKYFDSDKMSKTVEARQGCENDSSCSTNLSVSKSNIQNGGSSSPLLRTISQTLQAMNTAQSLSTLAHLLTGNDGHSSSKEPAVSESNGSPLFTQVLTALNSLNNGGSNSSVSLSNYNPLGAILEYFTNGASSNQMPARRKKPLELDDIISGLTASSSNIVSTNANQPIEEQSQIAPTPCPSIEEYVAPVFARNYQGIWKYVVQIPHEGYFTQTVQKTTCVKNKCDFIEGSCRESTRWLSLLVAEVYYPNPKQAPLNLAMLGSSSQLTPKYITPGNSIYNTFLSNNNDLNQFNQKSLYPMNMQSYFNYNNLSPINAISNGVNEQNRYDQLFSRRVSNSMQHNLPTYKSILTGNQLTNSQPSYNKYSLQHLFDTYYRGLAKHANFNMYGPMARLDQAARTAENMPNNNQKLYGLQSLQMQQSNLHKNPYNSLDLQLLNAANKQHNVKPRSIDAVSSRVTHDESISSSATLGNSLEDQNTASVNKSDTRTTGDSSKGESNSANEEECDGYDYNGCFVIRVYYDWFLVPGSCKCWKKPSSGGSFDTLKKIFTGK